jgi:DNA repair exonuclease SbcCD ATPase subunit
MKQAKIKTKETDLLSAENQLARVRRKMQVKEKIAQAFHEDDYLNRHQIQTIPEFKNLTEQLNNQVQSRQLSKAILDNFVENKYVVPKNIQPEDIDLRRVYYVKFSKYFAPTTLLNESYKLMIEGIHLALGVE